MLPNTKLTRRHIALSLALFLFALYLLSYRGGFHSVDEVSMFAVSESLVKFGRFNTDQIAWTQWTTSQAEAQGFFGPDGHVYSKKGLALSLAQAPLYWLALQLPGLGMLQTVSLLNALVTAATALLLFMFVGRLGYSLRVAIVTALIFGLATIAFVYAKYLFSEPLAGFFLLLAAYMLFTYRQEGGRRHLLIAGLAAGFAVVTRANNLFLLPAFGFYLLFIIRHQFDNRTTISTAFYAPFIRSVAAFTLGLAVPGLILLAYNAVRTGNPFQTGYDLTLFSPSVPLGLYKLLFSPLRGLFVYSPILILSLPGWQRLRKTHRAEAWLFAGLILITLTLFSAWSSGEGLSWGSRFLVPLVPFFVICLAPIVEQVWPSPQPSPKGRGSFASPPLGPVLSEVEGGIEGGLFSTENQTKDVSPEPQTPTPLLLYTFYPLLVLSLLIQILAVTINPWVYLSKLQTDFGGEFFLENTAALYDFRYSQIVGQIQNFSATNSDLVWWQPWGFDALALTASLALVLITGWTLRQSCRPAHRQPLNLRRFTWPLLLSLSLSLLIPYILLARYYHTDQQFGPPDDGYTQALNTVAESRTPGQPVITVAQYHYHLPMNRFKARLPLVGFAQHNWLLPQTALPLLAATTTRTTVPLVTLGFPPAAPDNAVEQWLALHHFKISDEWLPDDVRLVRFSARQPDQTRLVGVNFGQEIRLNEIKLIDPIHSGRPLPVEFRWLPVQQTQTDYSLFLQLLDIDGTLVAQHDGPPNGGYTPTSSWIEQQPVISRHALALSPDLPAGDYRLIAGLYNPSTTERLRTDTGADFVDLGIITIIP